MFYIFLHQPTSSNLFKASTWAKLYLQSSDKEFVHFQSSGVRQPEDQQALDKQTVHEATAAASYSSPIQKTKTLQSSFQPVPPH